MIVTDLRSGRSCLTPEKLNYKEEVFRFVQDDYYVLWRMKAMNIFSCTADNYKFVAHVLLPGINWTMPSATIGNFNC